jgi:AcrR family transcriptional regulator
VPRQPRHVKVTQEQYFAAALERLAADGPEGLTIGWLCGQLGVTSGSFYHYFGGWARFVEALLEHWEAEQTHRIVELAHGRANVEQRLNVMQQQASELPHAAEAAIRAWGRSDDRVRDALRRVDALRHAEVRALIAGIGVDPEQAELLATMALALLVGMQQLQRPVDVDVLRGMFDELGRTVRRYAGRAVGSPGPA